MAYANVQNSGLKRTSTGGGISWTPGTAPTLNNLLTQRVWGWSSTGYTPATTDATDSSGTPKSYTLDKATAIGSSSEQAGIYSLVVPSGLTTPLKNVNTASNLEGIFDEWSGNATSSIVDQTNTNSGISVTTIDTGSVNTGASAGLALAVLVIGGVGSANEGIASTGTSFTQDAVEQDSNTFQPGAAASRTASVGSQTGLKNTWTFTSSQTHAGAAIVTYKTNATTAYRDTASRLRLQTASVVRDTASRFKLQGLTSYRDVVTRLTLQSIAIYRDAASRFPLRAQAWRDTASRLRLRAQSYRDTASRFALSLFGQNTRDSATRFRLASTATLRDTVSRLRLGQSTFRDTRVRMVLSGARTRDIGLRFNFDAPSVPSTRGWHTVSDSVSFLHTVSDAVGIG